MRLIRIGLALLLSASVFSAAQAQTYPNKPIQIIVPYPPGGTAGLMGHLIAPKLAELLGQGVVIEQRPGAATRLNHDGWPMVSDMRAVTTRMAVSPALPTEAPLSRLMGFTG